MKKLLLFVIACTLGLFGAVNAQTTVTMGNGSAAEMYSPPIDIYYANGFSQQIFPASSLGIPSGSVISNIAFKHARGSSPTRTWSIYMQNSQAGAFVYPEYTVSSKPVESSDKVYSGTFTVPSEENVWVPFDLTEPFTYEGGDLILTVIDNTGASGGDHWWINSFGFGHSIHGGRDAAYNEGSDYSFNQRYDYTSDIQITYTAGEGGGEDPTPEPEQPGNDLIVTVGSGSEVKAFVPVNTNYDNTISQQIYLAEDFQGKTGKIKSYAFKCAKNLESYGTPITVTRNFKVYMINTDKSSFTSASDWAAVTESDLVFDGSVTFQPKDEWTVVTFDTQFEYEEGKNVLICINDASAWINGTMNYYSHVTENVRSLVFYADGNPYDATAIAVSSKFDNLNYVAQAQFEFVSEGGGETPEPEPTPTIPAAPAGMTATANGQNSITLTWEAVEGATSYNIYSIAAGNVLAVTATEYTYEGLTAGTQYCFEVTAENAAGESYDAAYACATTEEETEEPTPVAPAAPVVEASVTETTVTLTWAAVENATYYNIYTPSTFAENILGLTETTYTFEGLTAGTEYCFEVSAGNDEAILCTSC